MDINFAGMNEAEPKALRTRAMLFLANEKPNKRNNYCTFKRTGVVVSQPSDWTTTSVADKWCSYQGPSKHTVETTVETCKLAPASTPATKTAIPTTKKPKSQPKFLDPSHQTQDARPLQTTQDTPLRWLGSPRHGSLR
jgi:hypothetical protein